MKIIFIIIINILIINSIPTTREYKIGSFNVQVFGVTKMQRPGVPMILATIFRRYDISLIQEIRDISNTAIFDLLKLINSCHGCDQYNISLSKRVIKKLIIKKLGRSNSKEQYGFFYKIRKFKILNTFQYEDLFNQFERPPYSILFQNLELDFKIILSGCHIKPLDAVNEIDALHIVDEHIFRYSNFNETKLLHMGDYNAGCNYVPRSGKYIIF
jgi:hypothetical protein